MLRRILILLIAAIVVSFPLLAMDMDHTVYGGGEIEDILGASDIKGDTPYILDGDKTESVENLKAANGKDYIFTPQEEVSVKDIERKEINSTGYQLPGTFENQENYIEIDRAKMAKDFRKFSAGGINLTFIKNDYQYESTNDVINRTIGSGPKSIKGGSLLFRHDSYVMRSEFLNLHWSLGAGMGFNSGKGIFSTGTRSDTTINLWEIPIDFGLGMEIPVASYFKLAGTAGPSVLTLIQNRSDYGRGEKGKRKTQYSPGYFLNAQFKFNLSGFSDDMAYELFTSSEITNLYMNLEARHQSYEKFQDPISVTGTSFGIGFTFEYL